MTERRVDFIRDCRTAGDDSPEVREAEHRGLFASGFWHEQYLEARNKLQQERELFGSITVSLLLVILMLSVFLIVG